MSDKLTSIAQYIRDEKANETEAGKAQNRHVELAKQ